MQLINVNGDPLIDHDEWLEYMLKLLCGSFERRLFIVFQIYDLNNEEVLRTENMKLVLRHLPIQLTTKLFGISHDNNNEAHVIRQEVQRRRHADCNDIDQFVDIFFTDYTDGMVFSVFKNRIQTLSSEPFFAIISHFQELIPCFQNYVKARSHYKGLAKSNSSMSPSQKVTEIALPSLIKSKLKMSNQDVKKQYGAMYKHKSHAPSAVKKRGDASGDIKASVPGMKYKSQSSV